LIDSVERDGRVTVAEGYRNGVTDPTVVVDGSVFGLCPDRATETAERWLGVLTRTRAAERPIADAA
jgi:hypothetical protein